MVTGREVIDVLESVADVEWFRYSLPAAGIPSPAPVTVWRFNSALPDEQSNRVMDALRAVLAEFSGGVAWTLTFGGRNWVLVPTRFHELENSHRFRTDLEILDHLCREDPSLGKAAHLDLPRIAADLALRLGIAGIVHPVPKTE